MKLKLIFLTLFLATVQLAMAQVKFEAKVSRKKLGVNERLRIDFEMDWDVDIFEPPAFAGFTVVGSGPNPSISNALVNGKRLKIKTYNYFLEPTHKGKLTIKEAIVKLNGQTYKTLPVTVKVTSAVDNPKNDININENLYFIAEVSKSNPYLNEAITVVYKLYVSPRISVSNLGEFDNPKYSDFWSQAIDMKQLKIKSGEYKGAPYRYVVLRKTVLYPQKTGKLNIDPLSLTVSVDVPNNSRDIWGGRQYYTLNKTLATSNSIINAKPLPVEGKPDDFSGAVGSFDFEVIVNKTQLNTEESLDAKVLISGNGNLKLIDIPMLNIPNGLEQFEPQYNKCIKTNLTVTEGNISNTYTLVPEYKGKYQIPSISFSYFDLKTETYKRISSDEIVINVKKGSG